MAGQTEQTEQQTRNHTQPAPTPHQPPVNDPQPPSSDPPCLSQTDSTPATSPEYAPKNSTQDQNVKHILAMRVPLIVRIAQKKLRIAEVLKFNLGSVIHFDQDAYQHVDLMVNNEVIGLGQPVKIGENFGLKITQVGDLSDTIKRLGGNHT